MHLLMFHDLAQLQFVLVVKILRAVDHLSVKGLVKPIVEILVLAFQLDQLPHVIELR